MGVDMEVQVAILMRTIAMCRYPSVTDEAVLAMACRLAEVAAEGEALDTGRSTLLRV